MQLEQFKKEKILILGFQREGIDNLLFLRQLFPKKTFGIADKLSFAQLSNKAKKIINSQKKFLKLHLGKNYLLSLKKYKIIIKSPGIPLSNLKNYLKKESILTSQTNIFLEKYHQQTIGVTGTKGKSTTSTLIYKILKDNSLKTRLLGNIGQPVLSFFNKIRKREILVYELSSHQLSLAKISPHIAVLLNIYPEHLDYYSTFNDYLAAKRKITQYQTKNDYLVYDEKNKFASKIAQNSKAKTIPLGSLKIKSVLKKKDIPLKGKFNEKNLEAAIIVGKIIGLTKTEIVKALKTFKPLPHRLEFVGEYRGIKFYNDSLSTIPQATIEAIKAFPKVETVILGGYDRGLNFQNLAKFILKSKVKNLIFFPDTGQKIWKEIQKIKTINYPHSFWAKNMADAVKTCFRETKNGVCLLSPASASFNLFKNYKARGNLFKKYVKKYSH